MSITGSIGKEKDLIVHVSGGFSDSKMETIGGYSVEATVSGTAEIHLIKLPFLKKKYDEETGLRLFDFRK